MTFSDTHIELDRSDRWFVPDLGSHIGYDQMIDLYLGLQACYEQAIYYEFESLEIALDDGLSMEDALADDRVARPETTTLVCKLVGLHSVLINYINDGYSD